MTTNALSELDVDAPTVKRAQYEAFEFDLEAPGLLQVTNGSYSDDEKSAHCYCVNIENGVPVACECPSDTYHDGACKHRVAVAIREPVLEAAIAGDSQNRIATDGGELVAASEGEVLETDDVDETNAETEDCECSMLPGNYPCAVCYIDGDVEWPDEEGDTHRSQKSAFGERIPLFGCLSFG